jgi:hypothetical protein
MKPLTLALVLALLSAFLARPSEAATVEVIGSGAVFSWDAVTTDINGGPEVIAAYEIAAFPAGTDLTASPDTTPLSKSRIEPAQTQAGALAFLIGLPHGTPLRVSVRCYDLAGNVSDWCVPGLDCRLDFGKPMPPGQLKKIWPVVMVGGAGALVALALWLKRRK